MWCCCAGRCRVIVRRLFDRCWLLVHDYTYRRCVGAVWVLSRRCLDARRCCDSQIRLKSTSTIKRATCNELPSLSIHKETKSTSIRPRPARPRQQGHAITSSAAVSVLVLRARRSFPNSPPFVTTTCLFPPTHSELPHSASSRPLSPPLCLPVLGQLSRGRSTCGKSRRRKKQRERKGYETGVRKRGVALLSMILGQARPPAAMTMVGGTRGLLL